MALQLQRGLTDQMRERAGEVGLVEIARLLYYVENGRTAPEEMNGMPGTLDLPEAALGHARNVPEVPLDGAPGQGLWIAQESRAHRAIVGHHAASSEVTHEGFRVLEIRKLPSRSSEPETPPGAQRKIQTVVIQKPGCRELWQIGPEAESDGEPLPVWRAHHGGGPGYRTA